MRTAGLCEERRKLGPVSGRRGSDCIPIKLESGQGVGRGDGDVRSKAPETAAHDTNTSKLPLAVMKSI